jgi:hypothetical protein
MCWLEDEQSKEFMEHSPPQLNAISYKGQCLIAVCNPYSLMMLL